METHGFSRNGMRPHDEGTQNRVHVRISQKEGVRLKGRGVRKFGVRDQLS